MANQRKRRTKKSAPKRSRRQHASTQGPEYEVVTYQITEEPLVDDTVPEEVKKELSFLYESAQANPSIIIKTLENLITKYPSVPVLYNFISIAYVKLDQEEKSRYWIEQNIRKNPSYLFAKLNYCELLLADGEYDKVQRILGKDLDLQALYPKRTVFHITEVVNFFGIVGYYFCLTGDHEQANAYLTLLKQLAPKNSHTKRIKQHLKTNLLLSKLKRLIDH